MTTTTTTSEQKIAIITDNDRNSGLASYIYTTDIDGAINTFADINDSNLDLIPTFVQKFADKTDALAVIYMTEYNTDSGAFGRIHVIDNRISSIDVMVVMASIMLTN